MAITAQDSKLKPGYKQTGVGVIPEDWGVSKVGAEFEIKLGKMLDAEKNTGLPKPYLGNKAVQWDCIDISDLQTMAMSRSDLERFRLRHGDLLVCEGGEVGRAAIWEAPIEECYYQKALHRLRPLHSFNPRLMVELLRYWTDHGMLADFVSQTSIAHLTREKFIEVPIPVPPPAEQQAITATLSDVNALITSLDRLIAKKRDIKQATMQQLLTGKTRLPGFSGEWEVRKLGDVSEIKTGKKNNEDKVDSGAYPFFGYSPTNW
jgi:type I restriction enzyme, S subunit